MSQSSSQGRVSSSAASSPVQGEAAPTSSSASSSQEQHLSDTPSPPYTSRETSNAPVHLLNLDLFDYLMSLYEHAAATRFYTPRRSPPRRNRPRQIPGLRRTDQNANMHPRRQPRSRRHPRRPEAEYLLDRDEYYRSAMDAFNANVEAGLYGTPRLRGGGDDLYRYNDSSSEDELLFDNESLSNNVDAANDIETSLSIPVADTFTHEEDVAANLLAPASQPSSPYESIVDHEGADTLAGEDFIASALAVLDQSPFASRRQEVEQAPDQDEEQKQEELTLLPAAIAARDVIADTAMAGGEDSGSVRHVVMQHAMVTAEIQSQAHPRPQPQPQGRHQSPLRPLSFSARRILPAADDGAIWNPHYSPAAAERVGANRESYLAPCDPPSQLQPQAHSHSSQPQEQRQEQLSLYPATMTAWDQSLSCNERASTPSGDDWITSALAILDQSPYSSRRQLLELGSEQDEEQQRQAPQARFEAQWVRRLTPSTAEDDVWNAIDSIAAERVTANAEQYVAPHAQLPEPQSQAQAQTHRRSEAQARARARALQAQSLAQAQARLEAQTHAVVQAGVRALARAQAELEEQLGERLEEQI